MWGGGKEIRGDGLSRREGERFGYPCLHCPCRSVPCPAPCIMPCRTPWPTPCHALCPTLCLYACTPVALLRTMPHAPPHALNPMPPFPRCCAPHPTPWPALTLSPLHHPASPVAVPRPMPHAPPHALNPMPPSPRCCAPHPTACPASRPHPYTTLLPCCCPLPRALTPYTALPPPLVCCAPGFGEVKKRVRTTAGGSTGSVRNLRIREDTAK